MNRLALGTVQFGLPYGIANQSGQVGRDEVKAMLQLAAESGIDMLDTAIAYGESERCLGEVGCGAFKLITKLPCLPEACPDVGSWVADQLAQSLSRLSVGQVYGLMLHRPEQLLSADGEEIFAALLALKKAGKFRKIGISVYSPNDLDALIDNFPIDIVQIPFNLVDRRMHHSGWLKKLKELGIEVHARSAFLQGLLLMSETAIPAKFSPWSDTWRQWHAWLLSHDVGAVEACVAFSLSFSEIDRVVVGADSATQLNEIILAAKKLVSYDFPDLRCDDENLINPARWSM